MGKVNTVDEYLLDGCMRCKFGGTPECKVHTWAEELRFLRSLVLQCNLQEEIKWSMPCYTVNGKNVLMIFAFKDNCALSFFKGALLSDPKKLLEKAGENTQASRMVRITNMKDLNKNAAAIKALILEAIDVEKTGKKVESKGPVPIVINDQLKQRFKENPGLKKAFEALTPGKQRAYTIHFNEPKQDATKLARIDKFTPQILRGEGLHDQYAKKKG
ncbi:MAG: DUF1801 domain-containing protein [Flavobacteriales bacterium]